MPTCCTKHRPYIFCRLYEMLAHFVPATLSSVGGRRLDRYTSMEVQMKSSSSPRSERSNRNSRIVILATAQEISEVRLRAAENRLTVSAYVRASLGGVPASPCSLPTSSDLKLAGRLAKVSSGLTYLLRLLEQRNVTVGRAEITSNITDLKSVLWELAMTLRERH